MLAGCSNAAQQPPLAPAGQIGQGAAEFNSSARQIGRSRLSDMPGSSTSTRLSSGRSWISPEAKKDDLLYVSDPGNAEAVFVYSWPSGKAVGQLTGFTRPSGECVDKAGDVFVTNFGAQNIVEYAHAGTSPIKTLDDPKGYPNGCSYDPKTGNLAVANYGSDTLSGSVAIFKGSSGSPSYYSGSDVATDYFCGYDNKGNLFVDGEPSTGSGFAFAELPKGKKTLINITLNQSIDNPGGVQWDGKYIAVGDAGDGYQGGSPIYQFSIAGSSGTEIGSAPLANTVFDGQFWIQGKKVVVPNTYYTESDGWKGNVQVYGYPAGGMPKKTFTSSAYNYTPASSVISLSK
jgi:hypothetical protein